jgi:hypothetical protein
VRLQITIDRGLPVQLPAVAILEATKDSVHGLPQEGLRHPLGTYNVSVATVVDAATQVLNELEKTFPLVGEPAADRVLESDGLRHATRQLLLTNGEHIDACEKVLKCYFASDGNKYAKVTRDLRANLSWYGRHVLTQANHLKHRHSQVRTLCLYNDQLAVPSYFVESSIGSEAVGPDPKVHGPNNSAFSYSRQLQIFLCGLFYVSRTLSTILSSTTASRASASGSETRGLSGLIERISSFPSTLLPDEYGEPRAEVHCSQGHYVLSYSEGKPKKPPYQLVQFKTTFGGDGVTRSFQVPYMQG